MAQKDPKQNFREKIIRKERMLEKHLNEQDKFDQNSKITFISETKIGITLSENFRRDFFEMSATPKIC